MTKGISIIVCCHNSEEVIADTLRSISNLKFHSDNNIECILVDNCSTDGTISVAEKFNASEGRNMNLKIVSENKLGLSNARQRGFEESSFEYLILCDDDNRLSPDYAEKSLKIMEDNPGLGVAGGFGTAVSTQPFPFWFEEFKKSFSAGAQCDISGLLSVATGYVWGAGMVLRKSAVESLYSKGFRSVLTDRAGSDLSSGGDVELCYALKLHGFSIGYYDELKFDHFIKPSRLSWKYLRSLYRGFGKQKPLLDPYVAALREDKIDFSRSWKDEALVMVRRLRGYGISNLKKLVFEKEGDLNVLRIEKTIGRLQQLRTMKDRYTENFKKVYLAEWNLNSKRSE